MNTKLYVGNLSFDTTENDLQDLFQQHGPVSEVNLITDRMSGRSRGFAFVTMATPEGAQAAIAALAGKDLQGRALPEAAAAAAADNAVSSHAANPAFHRPGCPRGQAFSFAPSPFPGWTPVQLEDCLPAPFPVRLLP